MTAELEIAPSAQETTELPTCRVWGVPLVAWNFDETVDAVERLIQKRQPSYFITANLNYAMLTDRVPELREINRNAAFIVPDGIPLVIASRWKERRLPERVTGADLIFALCGRAATRGYRVYFLGSAPGVGDKAAERLRERYPGLQIVGVESPPFRQLTPEEKAAQLDRIRQAKPDMLFIAFGQPKGELWMAQNYQATEVPVSVQVGASIDFAAGVVRRAPVWVQKLGMEMPYRILQDPKRLAPRYARNIAFLTKMLTKDAFNLLRGRRAE